MQIEWAAGAYANRVGGMHQPPTLFAYAPAAHSICTVIPLQLMLVGVLQIDIILIWMDNCFNENILPSLIHSFLLKWMGIRE